MSYPGCEENSENAPDNEDGVTRVSPDHQRDTTEVGIEDDITDESLDATIEQAGSDVLA
jgi:hypothetical protein